MTKPVPPVAAVRRWFNMDGDRHSIGDESDCDCNEECPKCGSRVHYQAIYGGFYRICELCDIDDSTSEISQAGRP